MVPNDWHSIVPRRWRLAVFPLLIIAAGAVDAQTAAQPPANSDFLLDGAPFTARIVRSEGGRELSLENGLVRRTWRLRPNGACVAFDNLISGQAMLRSVRPEARVTLNGKAFEVGGLVGQPNHAYLTPEWLNAMTVKPGSLSLTKVEEGRAKARFPWKRRRPSAPDAQWPPPGVHLRFHYASIEAPGIDIIVHYELYDGIPAMSKWVSIINQNSTLVTINAFRAEELAIVEPSNWVEHRKGVPLPAPQSLHVETDFAFGGFNHQNANRHVVHWRKDPLFNTQVNWARQTPCLLVCEPTYGPGITLPSGETFTSFRVFEIALGEDNRERRSLTLRKFYRTVAPWVTENPLTHHLLSHDPEEVRLAIDQAKTVGFEAIILSFGSGFNLENRDPEFLAQWKTVADYAAAQGIELGAYSLFSSRNVGETHMIQSPKGQQPTHGQCPAVTSPWGQQWLKTVRAFFSQTGFDQFENDGPYPGDVDITPRPPLQNGINDSRWIQWQHTTALYRDLRAQGVYINAPDYYFLNGSNKCGMGYREVNWSLPRAQQVIHTRQNIYDGTWTKTPSMGWMFVPLSEYHGGGAAATIEPLHQHLPHYRRMLESNLSMGVQAHYRGPKLFDSPETKATVASVVTWFKQHRAILESDIIHGRRADGRALDWILHANPRLKERGMLCVFNPLSYPVTQTLAINLYYTGLTNSASVQGPDGVARTLPLDRNHSIRLKVTAPAQGMIWYVIE